MWRDDNRESRIIMKSKWRQRLRGTCKWGGVTLCVLLFALWFASRWCLVSYRRDPSTGFGVYIRAFWGRLNFGVISASSSPRTQADVSIGLEFSASSDASSRWNWWIFDAYYRSGNDCAIDICLWLPFLLIALPTGFLFWSDHRRRMRGGAGCCQKCGYNLTGNTTGKCPECGAESVKTTA